MSKKGHSSAVRRRRTTFLQNAVISSKIFVFVFIFKENKSLLKDDPMKKFG
jgi:hypothetical protein